MWTCLYFHHSTTTTTTTTTTPSTPTAYTWRHLRSPLPSPGHPDPSQVCELPDYDAEVVWGQLPLCKLAT
ncbi:hypothetical protein E2C01_033484 [Portunus trituberculatus]|uniref:Uncharacterized protein n=1 Tax=Portunus trituberculatus TaxID=210409 RepID=A0A5B7EYT0_PORTR|nr:hypothetical protein [Portunus trituberculatus]